MGAQLVDFYKKAEAKAGMQGKIKLAMITKMSSDEAEKAPDSPENIQKFQAALDQL